MQEVIFDLQITTPLFMAGADYEAIVIPPRQREGKHGYVQEGWDIQAEIRSPSFRGLMRYWLRADIGGLSENPPVSLQDVTLFEQSVFGATDHGSAIRMRTTGASKKAELFRKESYRQETVTGRDYLLWSMASSGKGEDYKPNRWYFPEGAQFTVTLSELRSKPNDYSTLPYGVASLWLLTHLGGVGSRSHRCAGSLQVQQVKGNPSKLSFSPAANKEELRQNLQQGIREIRTLSSPFLKELRKKNRSTATTYGSFDKLLLLSQGQPLSAPHSCRIWILTQSDGSPWKSLKEALNAVGTSLKTYRSALSVLDKTAFGLPLNVKLSDKALEKALRDNRRASPLLLRITQLSTGEYVGVAVLFKTSMNPISDPRKNVFIPAPNYSVIEQWIATQFRNSLEVRL